MRLSIRLVRSTTFTYFAHERGVPFGFLGWRSNRCFRISRSSLFLPTFEIGWSSSVLASCRRSSSDDDEEGRLFCKIIRTGDEERNTEEGGHIDSRRRTKMRRHREVDFRQRRPCDSSHVKIRGSVKGVANRPAKKDAFREETRREEYGINENQPEGSEKMWGNQWKGYFRFSVRRSHSRSSRLFRRDRYSTETDPSRQSVILTVLSVKHVVKIIRGEF